MNRNSRQNRLKNYLVFVLLIYFAAGILLLKYYRYQINPDGISYISIAQKYLNGDFSNAVNGWWGPMFSWLLAPLLLFGAEPLLTAKILNLLIGAAAIIFVRALSCRFEMPEPIRTAILFSAVPVVLGFAFSDITPDLLLMTLLCIYLWNIFSPDYGVNKKRGLQSGFWGGAAYLAKSYAFPFFIVHFFVMNVLHYFRNETKQQKKRVVHNFLTGAVTFALISGVWIGLLSSKYGKFTFGTSGRVAYGSVTSAGFQGLGIYWQGFLEPPNETALSIWEDPSHLKVPPRQPLGFWGNIGNQFTITTGLILKMVNMFVKFSIVSVVVAIAYVMFWLRGFNIKTMPAEVLFPTVAIVIFAGGYSLITVNARYIWLLFIMLMLMGGYVLGRLRLFENNFFTKIKRTALLIIFFLSFAVPAYGGLKSYANRGKSVHNLSKVLRNVIAPHSHIASNTNWPLTLFLSYHLNARYYGVQKKNITAAELKRELEKYGIDYYLLWGGATIDLRFLTNYEEITGGRVPGLRIYGLKKPR